MIEFANSSIPFAMIQSVAFAIYAVGVVSLVGYRFSDNFFIAIMSGFIYLLRQALLPT